MEIEDAAPCRHEGAPPEAIVNRIANLIEALATDATFLGSKGLTPEEYSAALPAAIERVRGGQAARSSTRREYLAALLSKLVERGLAASLEKPAYGKDTVYRLQLHGARSVAVIQKGCPDGAHSSTTWSRPGWADECYIWWLCSSMSSEPGVHVWKGVKRLQRRFFSQESGEVDGVIFQNELCGTALRPCPKANRSIDVAGHSVPPPCLYVMPCRDNGAQDWNWSGARALLFPAVLNELFGIKSGESASYEGYVGFRQRGAGIRTKVSISFGPGRTSLFWS